MSRTFAAAILGDTHPGWLVDAAPGDEAIEIGLGTVPRARGVCRSELLAWTEDHYRNQYLLRAPFPPSWTRL